MACDVISCEIYSTSQFLFTKQYNHVSEGIKNQHLHICHYFYGNLSSLEGHKLSNDGFTKQKMSLQTRKVQPKQLAKLWVG